MTEAPNELQRQLLTEQEYKLLKSEVRCQALRQISLGLIEALQEAGVTYYRKFKLEDLRSDLLVMQTRHEEGLSVVGYRH